MLLQPYGGFLAFYDTCIIFLSELLGFNTRTDWSKWVCWTARGEEKNCLKGMVTPLLLSVSDMVIISNCIAVEFRLITSKERCSLSNKIPLLLHLRPRRLWSCGKKIMRIISRRIRINQWQSAINDGLSRESVIWLLCSSRLSFLRLWCAKTWFKRLYSNPNKVAGNYIILPPVKI